MAPGGTSKLPVTNPTGPSVAEREMGGKNCGSTMGVQSGRGVVWSGDAGVSERRSSGCTDSCPAPSMMPFTLGAATSPAAATVALRFPSHLHTNTHKTNLWWSNPAGPNSWCSEPQASSGAARGESPDRFIRERIGEELERPHMQITFTLDSDRNHFGLSR